jgi:hypothetical protein
MGKKLIGICDGDKSGEHLARKCDDAIVLPKGKDLGDFDLYFVADTLRKLKSK